MGASQKSPSRVIAYVGRFAPFSTETYLAEAFEAEGHTVLRLANRERVDVLLDKMRNAKADILLYHKPVHVDNVKVLVERASGIGIKTVCWIFDLYFNLPSGFNRKPSDLLIGQDVLVTTTDTDYWNDKGIRHICVRQGIHEPEYFRIQDEYNKDVRFVGSVYGDYRPKLKRLLEGERDFEWVGHDSEVRGIELNKLLAKTKIVVGDSVPFPKYWSNRLYEIIGRGGFLIHPYVDGIKEEMPDLVTFERDNFDDLRHKLDYYLKNEKERLAIRDKCFESMKDKTYRNRVRELLCKLYE